MQTDSSEEYISWEEEVSRCREQIAAVCPEWTDYNVSDPGITLLELLVWMFKVQEYHVRQIGPEHERKLDRLLGIRQKNLEPARVMAEASGNKEWRIEKGRRFFAGGLCFEAVRDQAAVGRIFAGMEGGRDGETWSLAGEWLSQGKNIRVYPFGMSPGPGDIFTVRLRRPLPDSEGLTLYLELEGEETGSWDEEPYGPEGFYPLAEMELEYRGRKGWISVKMEQDETRSMQKSGCLSFRLPEPMDEGEPCLRFVLVRSEYRKPPVLVRISFAMAELRQQETVEQGKEFYGNGFPNQSFELEEPDLCPESVRLEAERILGWPESGKEQEEGNGCMEPWRQVEDFNRSSPSDLHFRIHRGRLYFGDGVHGMAPEGRIRITRFVRTLGQKGNLKPGAVFVPEQEENGLFLVNEREGFGGRDEETLEESLARWREEQKTPARAVTFEDFRQLILNAPGLGVKDCCAYSVRPEANEVSIAVLPPPGEAVKINLLRYLESRRLVGTRIRLVKPLEVRLRIYCEAVGKTQYPKGKKEVETAIRAFTESRRLGQPFVRSSLYLILDELPCIRKINVLEVDGGVRAAVNEHGDLMLPPFGYVVLEQLECALITEKEQ